MYASFFIFFFCVLNSHSAGIALILCFMYMSCIGTCGWVIVWMTITLSIVGGFLLGYAMIQKGQELKSVGWYYTGNFMYGSGITLCSLDAVFTLGIIFMRNRIRLATRVIREASKAMEDVPTIVFFPLVCFLLACGYMCFWIATAVYIYSVSVVVEYPLPDYLQQTIGQEFYKVRFLFCVFKKKKDN
ncbi:hypothetical protein RFI_07816 [Reticulomyxa filosa]|uniref:Choline transporter-like protein n=1 Tax=Reticulomyxa filosa TaxID=46433 RepID=X6NVJ4_RETFI|nr:hypothetical protein RFI_07816 [Reticulomyxa filosa]|eukprot:ETO29307.1 hypothetical protein RFI_07816 [Reticulomyxa filosa]